MFAETFFKTGSGLPIPSEGNFYGVMWRADLVERLILMQIQTETPAVKTLAKRKRGALCNRIPMLKWVVEVVDEISHARIGHFWLRHLIPSKRSREEAKEVASLLRGVLLAAVIAPYENSKVSELIEAYSGKGSSLPSTAVTFASYPSSAI